MLVDERPQWNIRQNVPAISNERLAAELGLNVFYPTAGFEQYRFVHERKIDSRVTVFRKCRHESFRQPMGVDEKFADTDVDQMIESKCNQRLLKNRNKRLWQFVSERTQPGAKSGAQDECLFDRGHHGRSANL